MPAAEAIRSVRDLQPGISQPLANCPELLLYPPPLEDRALAESLAYLLSEHSWPDNSYEVCGRMFTLPRQQTWHADPGIVYCYSNNLLTTTPWFPVLSRLRQSVSAVVAHDFNAVLVNLYRDGGDYVGWHADDEKEMGEDPVIASLSLGAERTFMIRHQETREIFSVPVRHGTLLVMAAPFQRHWEHAVLPEPDSVGARVNLTFRQVLPPPGLP